MKNAGTIRKYITNIDYYISKIKEAIAEEVNIVSIPPPTGKVINERIEKIMFATLGTIDMNTESAKYFLHELMEGELQRYEKVENEHYVKEGGEVTNE
jgi:hypothetical protein